MKKHTESLVTHLKASLDNAKKHISKIPNDSDILNIKGMTSKDTRHFYNNILSLELDRPLKYLEVGTWAGSSFISALYKNNTVEAIAIDNWSEVFWAEFGGAKQQFIQNLNRYLDKSYKFSFIEKDCFTVDLGDNLFDIYMYDGGHEYEDHLKAITYFKNNLAESSIIIIDDWNWNDVRQGTFDGLEEANLTVIHKEEIITPKNASPSFWNGMAAFVVEK